MYYLTLEVRTAMDSLQYAVIAGTDRNVFLLLVPKQNMTQPMSLGSKRVNPVRSYSLRMNMSPLLWIRVIQTDNVKISKTLPAHIKGIVQVTLIEFRDIFS